MQISSIIWKITTNAEKTAFRATEPQTQTGLFQPTNWIWLFARQPVLTPSCGWIPVTTTTSSTAQLLLLLHGSCPQSHRGKRARQGPGNLKPPISYPTQISPSPANTLLSEGSSLCSLFCVIGWFSVGCMWWEGTPPNVLLVLNKDKIRNTCWMTRQGIWRDSWCIILESLTLSLFLWVCFPMRDAKIVLLIAVHLHILARVVIFGFHPECALTWRWNSSHARRNQLRSACIITIFRHKYIS